MLNCTIFMLALAVSGIALAKPPTATCPEHPSCKDAPTDTGVFDIVIKGDLSGDGSGWRQESGQSQVVYNEFWDDVGTFGLITDLDFFRNQFPGTPDSSTEFTEGDNCFPVGDTFLFSALLKKGKKSSAIAVFWFDGWTNNGSKDVLYRLELHGEFDESEDFPPAKANQLLLDVWSLKVENEGKTIRGISCIGEGDTFPPEDGTKFEGVTIDVTRQE